MKRSRGERNRHRKSSNEGIKARQKRHFAKIRNQLKFGKTTSQVPEIDPRPSFLAPDDRRLKNEEDRANMSSFAKWIYQQPERQCSGSMEPTRSRPPDPRKPNPEIATPKPAEKVQHKLPSFAVSSDQLSGGSIVNSSTKSSKFKRQATLEEFAQLAPVVNRLKNIGKSNKQKPELTNAKKAGESFAKRVQIKEEGFEYQHSSCKPESENDLLPADAPLTDTRKQYEIDAIDLTGLDDSDDSDLTGSELDIDIREHSRDPASRDGTHKVAHEIDTESLKKRLLRKTDWVGLVHARPVKMTFPKRRNPGFTTFSDEYRPAAFKSVSLQHEMMKSKLEKSHLSREIPFEEEEFMMSGALPASQSVINVRIGDDALQSTPYPRLHLPTHSRPPSADSMLLDAMVGGSPDSHGAAVYGSSLCQKLIPDVQLSLHHLRSIRRNPDSIQKHSPGMIRTDQNRKRLLQSTVAPLSAIDTFSSRLNQPYQNNAVEDPRLAQELRELESMPNSRDIGYNANASRLLFENTPPTTYHPPVFGRVSSSYEHTEVQNPFKKPRRASSQSAPNMKSFLKANPFKAPPPIKNATNPSSQQLPIEEPQDRTALSLSEKTFAKPPTQHNTEPQPLALSSNPVKSAEDQHIEEEATWKHFVQSSSPHGRSSASSDHTPQYPARTTARNPPHPGGERAPMAKPIRPTKRPKPHAPSEAGQTLGTSSTLSLRNSTLPSKSSSLSHDDAHRFPTRCPDLSGGLPTTVQLECSYTMSPGQQVESSIRTEPTGGRPPPAQHARTAGWARPAPLAQGETVRTAPRVPRAVVASRRPEETAWLAAATATGFRGYGSSRRTLHQRRMDRLHGRAEVSAGEEASLYDFPVSEEDAVE